MIDKNDLQLYQINKDSLINKKYKIINLKDFLNNPTMVNKGFYYLCNKNLQWIMNIDWDFGYKQFYFSALYNKFETFNLNNVESTLFNWEEYKVLICNEEYFVKPTDIFGIHLEIETPICFVSSTNDLIFAYIDCLHEDYLTCTDKDEKEFIVSYDSKIICPIGMKFREK